jgi:hypothetical protein
VAFALLPAAFGVLAGWNLPASLALTAIMLVRSVPTVLTVRACLRIRKGQAFSIYPALVTAAVGIFLTMWLAALQLMPWAAVAFALVFAARTSWLLLGRPRLTARTLGITEAVLGALMVLVLSFA